MAELTDAERKWLKRVQRALDACPSEDIGFYTIGDYDLEVYRKPESGDLGDDCFARDTPDFCRLVQDADAHLDSLKFPNQVHSTAG